MNSVKILPYIKIYDFGVYSYLIEDNKYFGFLIAKNTRVWVPLFMKYKGYLREKGPAFHDINSNAGMWYQHPYMLRHRLDGPQVEYSNGNVEFWLNDKMVGTTWESFNKYKKYFLALD